MLKMQQLSNRIETESLPVQQEWFIDLFKTYYNNVEVREEYYI